MKLKFNFGIFLILIVFSVQAQDTLLLFHPTSNNLETIRLLSARDLLYLEGYHVLGVYHNKENYDFQKAQVWVDKHPAFSCSLMEIGGELHPLNIFGENPGSRIFRELFRVSNGVLFMGGPDIPPVVYGEETHLCTEVTDPYRHYLELSYLFHLLGGNQDLEFLPFMNSRPEYLVSGICLGMQSMNVATGGSLVQDIPSQIYEIWTAEQILALPTDQAHRNYADRIETNCSEPTSYHFHHIHIEKGSFLTRKLKYNHRQNPLVLSSHHQAIGKMGLGMKVSARSMDSRIIEALEHNAYPHVYGVQFHPEKPGLFDPSIEHEQSCSQTINFQKSIAGTSAFDFHNAYWEMLGKILQDARKQ